MAAKKPQPPPITVVRDYATSPSPPKQPDPSTTTCIDVDWPEMVSFRDFVSDEVRRYIGDKAVMQSDMLNMELIVQLRRLSENLERSRTS